MALHLHLTVADNQLRAAFAHSPDQPLATTSLDTLPSLEQLRVAPFRQGISLASIEKNAPYLYAGFASGAGGNRMQPGIGASTPITLPTGSDQQPGGMVGTLQYVLDEIRRELRRVKGAPTWLSTVNQNLTELLHLQSPVDEVTDLPLAAALDDLRYVRATNQR